MNWLAIICICGFIMYCIVAAVIDFCKNYAENHPMPSGHKNYLIKKDGGKNER